MDIMRVEQRAFKYTDLPKIRTLSDNVIESFNRRQRNNGLRSMYETLLTSYSKDDVSQRMINTLYTLAITFLDYKILYKLLRKHKYTGDDIFSYLFSDIYLLSFNTIKNNTSKVIRLLKDNFNIYDKSSDNVIYINVVLRNLINSKYGLTSDEVISYVQEIFFNTYRFRDFRHINLSLITSYPLSRYLLLKGANVERVSMTNNNENMSFNTDIRQIETILRNNDICLSRTLYELPKRILNSISDSGIHRTNYFGILRYIQSLQGLQLSLNEEEKIALCFSQFNMIRTIVIPDLSHNSIRELFELGIRDELLNKYYFESGGVSHERSRLPFNDLDTILDPVYDLISQY